MGGYSKILVAFDGSDSAINALKQTFSKFEQSWIKVLIAVPAYEGDLELVGVHDLEALLRGPVDDLTKMTQEIVGSDSSRVSIEAVQGEAFERIVDMAEKESCNLIVMGRRGLHRVERMLMGSVTAKVIVHTTRDILVVPRNANIDWGNILLAIDGSEFSNAALDRALEFAGKASGGLTAISVVDMYPENYADATEVVEKMGKKALAVLDDSRAKAEAAGVELQTQVLHGDPAEEITAYAKKNGAGVVFLGSRGLSGLKKIFLGSVAEKVIGLSDSPVYVVKP